MRLGTANIRNFPDMAPTLVQGDALTVMDWTSLCGLQEITPVSDSPAIREVMRGAWSLVGARCTTPFLVNGRVWTVVSHNVTRHPRPKPDASRRQHWNPHHDVASIVVRSVKRPRLPAFAVVNTHLVSGGYNGSHDPATKQVWDLEWERTRLEVQHLRSEGLSVFLVGDLNNPRPPEVPPRAAFEWLTPQRSPDHIGLLEHPESVGMVSAQPVRVALNSDHDLHVIQGPLTRSAG